MTDGGRAPAREVWNTDALAWLAGRGVIEGASFVTSLPDVSELAPMSLDEWRGWFARAARRVIDSCPPDGVAIFYQSDAIAGGEWIDKGYLAARAAEEAGARTLFHRIVCRAPPGAAVFGRPAFSHMLCFSTGIRLRAGVPRVDVLPGTGAMTWTRGMGVAACVEAIRFVRAHTASRVIVDPFCGVGTALAVANALGIDAIGVELSRRRAQKAKSLAIPI